MNSYNVWNYAEGHDSYYSAMLVDLTLPPDKVSSFIVIIITKSSIFFRTSGIQYDRRSHQEGIATPTRYVETLHLIDNINPHAAILNL